MRLDRVQVSGPKETPTGNETDSAAQQQPEATDSIMVEAVDRTRYTIPGPQKPGHPGNSVASPEARSTGHPGAEHAQARTQDQAGRRPAHGQAAVAEPEAEEEEKTGDLEAPPPPRGGSSLDFLWLLINAKYIHIK